MAFSLCMDLGYPHPDYLLPLLSSKQLSDWEAFYLIQRGQVTIPEKLDPDQLAAKIDSLFDKVK